MNLPASMLAGVRFDRWPAIWLPRGVSGVEVAGATVGDAVGFRIPADRRVVGLAFFPQSGQAADAAGLELRIQDEEADDLIFDGVGTQADLGSFTVPAVALSGVELGRVFALDRIVKAGSIWTFTVRNDNAGAVTPIVALYHEGI